MKSYQNEVEEKCLINWWQHCICFGFMWFWKVKGKFRTLGYCAASSKVDYYRIKGYLETNFGGVHLRLPSPCQSLAFSMIRSQRTRPPSRPCARWSFFEGSSHRTDAVSRPSSELPDLGFQILADWFLRSVHDSIWKRNYLFNEDLSFSL